jgi:hypothetical protein
MGIRHVGKPEDRRDCATVSIRYEDRAVREFAFVDLRLSAFAESVPWRRVRSVHGKPHFSGSYAAATTGGFVVYESRLELARLLLADFDPDVRQIFAQPCWLRASVAGRRRRHVPDFLLVSASGAVRVVNVKPEACLADPAVREALAWPGELVRAHGWEYEVWSGADAVELENVRFLAAYRRPGVVDAVEVERAWTLVPDGVSLSVAEHLVAGGGPGHLARPALLALVWSGRLVTDLSRPLGPDSVLWRAS